MDNLNKKLDFYTRQMAAIIRKQIPLCRYPHQVLHNNTWIDIEKNMFNYESKKIYSKTKAKYTKKEDRND